MSAFPVGFLSTSPQSVSWVIASVATEFPDLSANVSYDTQRALNESPLDVSNNMRQSDGNVKLRTLPVRVV
ncbi:hypothetical protein DSO57_1034293 [Entomophthora muscae]|uniref:Uncharacterized protein n=1 Tax=Entomophthora muscae TaxID=34485 RepID=A0ACC2UJX9_9FUNG|nr:hypothetical protein DSO57_1034293 [Entomophthora muscae]